MIVGMPKRKEGMTLDELKAIMTANGIENGNQLALKLELDRSTTSRWLRGLATIDRGAAALIRSKLRKRA